MEKFCFIFYLYFFQTLPIYSIRTEKCLPSTETIRKLENQYGVQLLELNHNVTFNYVENIVITNFAVSVTEIYLGKVEVNLTERITARGNYNDSNYAHFYAENVVVHRSKHKNYFFDKNTYNCEVIDWNSSQLRINSSTSRLIIENLTKICIEDSVCKQYDAMISDVILHDEKKEPTLNLDIKNQSDLQSRNSKNSAVASDKKNPVLRNALASEQNYNPQNTINAIFDFAVSAVVTIVAGNDDGVMHLPHIDNDYKLARVTGEFQAFNGTFIDLRALYRTSDVVLTNEKIRFMVATSFRLEKAKLTFPSYRLRYGYIKIDGHLDVDIDGITVSIKLAADYNASPCEIHLVELTMDELGETKVDFSGLGWPLNSAVKMAIRYIIQHKVFQVAKDIAAVKMKELNCEQFRPSLGMFNNTSTKNSNVLFRKSHH